MRRHDSKRLKFTRVYLNNMVVILKSSYKDHLQKVDKVLEMIMEVDIKVNIKKCTLGKTET